VEPKESFNDKEWAGFNLSCRVLWLQNLIASGSIILRSISGHTNPADIGTKRLSAGRMKSLMSVLGLFNNATGALEGFDDPAKVFCEASEHQIHSVRLEPASAARLRR